MAFAGGLGFGPLGFLLAVTAGSCILGSFSVLALDRLLVDAMDIRMGRGYARNHVGGPPAVGGRQLVALLVDNTGPGLVFGLEFDFALELLDLFVIQEVAVLVAVLNFLFLAENLGGWFRLVRDSSVVNNRFVLFLFTSGDRRAGDTGNIGSRGARIS